MWVWISAACVFSTLASANPLNVLGEGLSTCSKPGNALTGFTRDGHCQDQGNDDEGSHHICIKMKRDFCLVTGQPNWCESNMTCMGQQGTCAIKNWCVCQWAFAAYIQKAGGCNSIVDIQCDATNMAALRAYRGQASDPHIAVALDCLSQRCSIPPGIQESGTSNLQQGSGKRTQAIIRAHGVEK